MTQGIGHRAQGTAAQAARHPGSACQDLLLARVGGAGGRERPGDGWSGRGSPRQGGFTLIELIVVVAIIGILATIAVPAMRTAPIRARESALKEDLFTFRSCIDQFHADRGRYPTSLDELVSMGYLRSLPVDPVDPGKEWVPVFEEVTGEEGERQQEAGQGIIDVHSGSDKEALDKSKYADW
jgi:general secretion pathway protein G